MFGHSSQCCAVQGKAMESSVWLSSQGKMTILSVEVLQVYKAVVAMSVNSLSAFLTNVGSPKVHPSYKLVTHESIGFATTTRKWCIPFVYKLNVQYIHI